FFICGIRIFAFSNFHFFGIVLCSINLIEVYPEYDKQGNKAHPHN
uniref:Uncharacterized protein n=1 Tax=Triticum urartu TaxID=4572 RepID=A0A8R7R0Y3_TRIUA